MVKPVVLVLAAIPGLVAVAIAVPMLTQTEIPFSAATPNDRLELEYTRHHLKRVSFGVTDRVGSERSEILKIASDGSSTYSVIDGGRSLPERGFDLSDGQMLRLTAFIKETGVAAIPAESFPVQGDATEYQKSVLKITLNGQHRQLSWPEQNATDRFIPPIITQLEAELDGLLEAARGE